MEPVSGRWGVGGSCGEAVGAERSQVLVSVSGWSTDIILNAVGRFW